MTSSPDLPPHHRFAHFAMATEFELLVADVSHQDGAGLASEVFREIDRLERELSRFLEGSDIYRINHAAPGSVLRVGPEAFACLRQAVEVSDLTGGAFDVTFGSQGTAENPLPEDGLLALDESCFSVEVLGPGVRVDLGGIGKGFALDWVGDIIKDWEMTHCLIQSGGSSILTFDPPDGHSGWPIGVGLGSDRQVRLLKHQALCASGIEVKGEHIIDVRRQGTGRRSQQTWVLAPQASWADALSTAFMLMRLEDIDRLCRDSVGLAAVIIPAGRDNPSADSAMTFGEWPPSVSEP